ncbi:hypothetical protein [Ancylobacter sp.]|uniref:hypothetical protein n=1 Tax=Ancylobacter sp. TaxID=1872567 RepID=UPI003C7DB48A
MDTTRMAEELAKGIQNLIESAYSAHVIADWTALIATALEAAANSEQSKWNTDMSAAPKDGTIINVVARYPMATAGSPTYSGYYEGRWYEYSKNPPAVVIPWAWRPRDEWPQEPAAPAAE